MEPECREILIGICKNYRGRGEGLREYVHGPAQFPDLARVRRFWFLN